MAIRVPCFKKMIERIQNNNIMSSREKRAFSKIIRNMPWLYKNIINSVDKYKNCNTLIDVCCGDGFLLSLLNESNFKLTGLDIDSHFINKARKEFKYDFILSDAFNIEKNYDIITCNLALHHFEKPVELIKYLFSKCNNVLIISDQLRPDNGKDLERRLKLRKKLLGGNDVEYYAKNEKESILEAYSKSEILDILTQTNLEYDINFFEDYYERFVVEVLKEGNDK